MRFRFSFQRNESYTYNFEDGNCIITHHKFPRLKILYNQKNRSGSIIEKELNVSEERIQEAYNKAIAFARKNINA